MGGHLFFASWPTGKIHRTDGETISLVATVPGRMGSNVAWLTGAREFLFATGFGSERIYAVDQTGGGVHVVAGDGIPGYRDGPALAARFSAPNGIGVTASGDTAYVSELLTMRGGAFPENRLRRIVGVREALLAADADAMVNGGVCQPPGR